MEKKLFWLHVETTVALQICMALLTFETGKYERKPDWTCGEWAKMKSPCVYFKGVEDCTCNNHPDEPGECVYENGIEPAKPAAKCKWYKESGVAT